MEADDDDSAELTERRRVMLVLRWSLLMGTLFGLKSGSGASTMVESHMCKYKQTKLKQ